MTPAPRSFGRQPGASAAARPHGSQARGSVIKRSLRLLSAGACLCSSAPAAAEVGASASLFSDARFRGYSLSAGHPVATFDLSYDDPSGLYGALSATAVLGTDEAIAPMGLQLNGGYAKRLKSGIVADFGVTHSNYSRYSSRASASYTEIYAGVSRKALSARISYAPHYFASGYSTLYGEVNASISPMPKLSLYGHVGLLVALDYPEASVKPRTQHDWSFGVSRQAGPVSLHAILTGGGPDADYYHDRAHSRTKLVFGVSYPL
mgnify:CR=1 FL=1